jgi:hypothetical protein
MATSFRKDLQPGDLSPAAIAYRDRLQYDCFALESAIKSLPTHQYKALQGQAGPLKSLERHGQSTDEERVAY